METEKKQKLNAPRKSKRASEKATNLLVIPKINYIGKYYTNGVTVELTTNHAVVSRFNCINIYPTESVNYMMLRYIYELEQLKERTEEQEKEFKGGQMFVSSLTMGDHAAANMEHYFDLYDQHLRYLTDETEAQIKEMQEDPERNTSDLNHVKMNFVESIEELVKDAENE